MYVCHAVQNRAKNNQDASIPAKIAKKKQVIVWCDGW